MLSGATDVPGQGEKGTVLLCYKSSTETAGAFRGGLKHRQKQALPSQARGQSVAVLQPCHGHCGRQGIAWSKPQNLAITHSLGRVEKTSLQSFTLASLTLFFFFGGNAFRLMKLVLGKIPLGHNGRERAVPGHCESKRSFPFVPGLGFRPGCAPAPMGTLARSRWLFCRGIFLWELLLHCTAN